jgi:hypothetical protein
VARRRESIPPPSVSRVIQKLGLPVDRAEIAPAPGPTVPPSRPTPPVAAPPPARPAAQPAQDMRSTMLGHGEAPAQASVAAPPFDPRSTRLGHDSGPSGAASAPAAPNPAPPVASAPLIAPVPIPVPVPPPMVISSPAIALPPASSPPTNLRETAVGTVPPMKRPTQPPPIAAAEAATPAAPAAEPRRRTGTPRVGVPVAARAVEPVEAVQEMDPVDPSQAPRTGQVDVPPERSDQVRKPTGDPSAISQVWYEDEEPDKARKLVTVSTTDMYADEVPHQRTRSLPLALIAGGVLLVGGAVALALGVFGGGSSPAASPPPAPVVAAAPLVDAAPAKEITSDPAATPDAGVEAAVDATPAVVSTPPGPPPPAPVRHDPPRVDPPPPVTHPTVATVPAPTNDDPGSRRPRFGEHPVSPAAPTTNEGAGGPQDPYGAKPEDTNASKAEFYSNLGTRQLDGGDTASAAASFKKASELDPKNAAAAIGLGEIALRQGLFGDAIAHLNRAARLAPKNPQIYTLLGEAYLNSSQNKLAADNFKKALQIDPDNARARDGFNEAQSRVPAPAEDQ